MCYDEYTSEWPDESTPMGDPRVTEVVKSLTYLLQRIDSTWDEMNTTTEDWIAYNNCIEALKIYNNE